MNIRTTISTIVLVLLTISSVEAQVLQGAKDDSRVNKKRRYVNPLVVEDAGRLADPVVIRMEDKYYLYATGGLAWSSDDLVNWEYHELSLPEGVDIAAPGVLAYDGYVYLAGNYTGLYRSRNPLGPFEFYGDFQTEDGVRLDVDVCKGCRNGGAFDVAFFVDEDERVYLYYAGRSINGVYGVELDPTDPKKLLGPIKHFFKFESSHIWERYGTRNEYSGVSWIEGPWMTKRNGTYYLQYSAPGTDWKTYAVGVYTSKSPMGPFTYYQGSPILVHDNELINGCGHHSVVEGPDGTVWAFYSLLYRNWNRMFERRIGMDPVGFDEQGNMFIDGPTDLPQWAPGVKANPERGNDSDVIPLSEDKSYTVSSEAPGRDAPYAFDNDSRTWWAPTENDDDPWLILDLAPATESDPMQEYIIDSTRILFALPTGLKPDNIDNRIRQYKIEVSREGKSFTTVVDKTKNDKDNAVEFDEITPIQCRYVKLTITGWPEKVPCGVLEFTVFGKSGQAYPPAGE